MSDSPFVPASDLTDIPTDKELDLMALVQTKALTEDGSCSFELAGNALVACSSGILFWPEAQTLIVADLHLEKGSSLARRGQFVPPYDTLKTLDALIQSISFWRPTRVIALGDSFHDENSAARLPLPARAKLDHMMTGRDWIWISGNHDPSPPTDLGGDHAHEIREEGMIFRHEPQTEDADGEIAGHLHPSARIVVRGRSIRRSCFVTTETRCILPSFGAYTGGLSVRHEAFTGLMNGNRFNALMRGDGQIYRISGREIR